MTTTKQSMYARIEEHGRQLLAVFPRAKEQDPVKLCKRLRRLEAAASAIGLQLCNGPEMGDGEQERRVDGVLAKVNKLLGNAPALVPVFVNLDPRGYSLKIKSEWMDAHRATVLHRDWGGYGILAPDLTESE